MTRHYYPTWKEEAECCEDEAVIQTDNTIEQESELNNNDEFPEGEVSGIPAAQLSEGVPNMTQATTHTQNLTGLPHVHQAPSTTAIAVDGLSHTSQGTSLAQNPTGPPHDHQASTTSTTTHMLSIQTSIVEQLGSVQAQRLISYLPYQTNQATANMTNEYLRQLQRLSTSQPLNPHVVPTSAQEYDQLIRSLIQESMIKDQIIASLLSQQQIGVQNISMTAEIELFLQRVNVNSTLNSEHLNQGHSSVATSACPLQQQPHETNGNITGSSLHRTSVEATASDSAADEENNLTKEER